MEFQKLIDRAITVRKQYSEKEQNLYGSSWTSEEIALGFVGDAWLFQGRLTKMKNVALSEAKGLYDD